MQNNNALIGWGVVILIGTGVATFFGVRNIIRANTVAPFQKELDTYLSGAGIGFSSNAARTARGKIITVDAGKRAIDYVYFDLPDEMRAEKPEEVGTVAVLGWSMESYKGQSYADGVPAMVQTCVVRVYQKEGMFPVAEKRLVGGPPPQARKRSQAGVGSKPTSEVVDFLKTVYVQGMLKK